VDDGGHDADLALAGSDDAGAVGTDEAHRFVLEIVFTRIMSMTGMPSVMQTIRGTSASAASMMASAAKGGGTKIMLALAPAILTASDTVLKTGTSSIFWPPFPGVTPATTWVP
jgi:hypothetical protein